MSPSPAGGTGGTEAAVQHAVCVCVRVCATARELDATACQSSEMGLSSGATRHLEWQNMGLARSRIPR